MPDLLSNSFLSSEMIIKCLCKDDQGRFWKVLILCLPSFPLRLFQIQTCYKYFNLDFAGSAVLSHCYSKALLLPSVLFTMTIISSAIDQCLLCLSAFLFAWVCIFWDAFVEDDYLLLERKMYVYGVTFNFIRFTSCKQVGRDRWQGSSLTRLNCFI